MVKKYDKHIVAHLETRSVKDFSNIVLGDACCYFLLYNLSGQMVGVQRYSPEGAKVTKSKERNRKKAGYVDGIRYVTYVTAGQIGVYGLHTYKVGEPLYITEGVFDIIRIHNLGLPGIAVLTNDCKPFRSWLNTLHNKKIIVEDNDKSGSRLRKFGDEYLTCPDPYKDLNEMPEALVKKLIYG